MNKQKVVKGVGLVTAIGTAALSWLSGDYVQAVGILAAAFTSPSVFGRVNG